MILSNDIINACLNKNSFLEAFQTSGTRLMICQDNMYVLTDRGRIVLHIPYECNDGVFRYDTALGQFILSYEIKPGKSYFERTLEFIPDIDLTVFEIGNLIRFIKKPVKSVHYNTFRNASTAAFVRYHDFGIFTGFANPFFESVLKDSEMTVSFKPSLILKKGEAYTCDVNFWGGYKISGTDIYQQIPKTPLLQNGRYFTRYRNPSGHIPLDQCEIKAICSYAEDYLRLNITDFKFIFYNYFCPLPQQPSTDAEEAVYYRYIDNFVSMGGDFILFNPLQRQKPPTGEKDSNWEIASPASRAERIIKYARSKGLKYGIYMGSAQANVKYCNSPMNEYASQWEKPDWKKAGKGGEISRENCIASDSFADWYFEVQKNTIAKYEMNLWNWDPGLGNGCFCYSNKHGHIPGRGAYKGFRNAIKTVEKIRKAFPGIFLMAFHGMKEYGLWGFRYFDQHEAYWEQDPYFFAAMYPDISDDRVTADGMRFQSWWDVNFRFMPVSMNHSLASRMTQNCESPADMRKLFDYTGYKYALMSALAAGSSATVTVLPEYFDNPLTKEYLEFYRYWIGWAKRTFTSQSKNTAFGSQVQSGGIDGWAKTNGNTGFIFLCNPSPVPADIRFMLGRDAGLELPDRYSLTMLYPDHNIPFFDTVNEHGEFMPEDEISVTIDPYQVFLFEVKPSNTKEVLYNISGSVKYSENNIYIENSYGFENEQRTGVIYTEKDINEVYVNGQKIEYVYKPPYLYFKLCYGENKYPKYLYEWFCEAGEPVQSPDYRSKMSAGFYASEEMKHLLIRAGENLPEDYDRTADLLSSALKREFPWARPNKIYLVISFADASKIDHIEVSINDGDFMTMESQKFTDASFQMTTVSVSFMELNEKIIWGAENKITLAVQSKVKDHFLGGYLLYPEPPATESVHAGASIPVLSHPLIYEKPVKKDGRDYKITAAWIKESLLEEYSSFHLWVSINRPPDEINGVYVSCPVSIDGFSVGMCRDRALEYDPADMLWKAEFKTGGRQLLIIDDEYLYVWFEDNGGFVSDTERVRLEWKLY
jgi:hypothetical protein